MATTQELREKVHSLKTQMRDLVKRAEDEKREMSADELTQFEQMSKDQDIAERELSAKMRVLEQRQKDFEAEERSDKKPDESKDHTSQYRAAYSDFMTRGKSVLSQEQKQILMRGTNPLSSTTGNLGGYTVPETYSSQLIEQMKWYGGMMEAATIIPTNSGEKMYHPRS